MANSVTITLAGVTATDNAIKQWVFDTYNRKNETPLASVDDVTSDHINTHYHELTCVEVHTNEQRNHEAGVSFTDFS